MGKFAEHTSVSAEKSKVEIEQVLARYGASSFASGWKNNEAVIAFEAKGRRIRFILPLPEFGKTRGGRYNYLMTRE